VVQKDIVKHTPICLHLLKKCL